MRIMVCFDGSAAAEALLAPCRLLAEAAQAEVHLVRAVPHRLTPEGEPWSGSDVVDIDRHAEAEAEDRTLRAELEQIAASFPGPTAVAVLSGPAPEELIRYARTVQIDLIAVGCRDRGADRGGIGGTTVRRIAESKVAPLLVGPMVLQRRVATQAVAVGYPVFTRDGHHLGTVAELAGSRMRVAGRDGTDRWLAAADGAALLVSSGLRLDFDRADLPKHVLEPPA
jgi:nucleotide-binding universal stress UspA family protein